MTAAYCLSSDTRASGSKIQNKKIEIWFAAARPKTLPAAFAPVLIGTAMAWEAGAAHWLAALAALWGALWIQIGTNFANDYADFLKGADTGARKGPLRATQAGLITPRAMRLATAFAFGVAALAGVYLVWRGGWPILLIGVLSIISGVLYTVGPYPLAYLGLGDLFVLVFFGPVAVGGTFWVQALAITPSVVFVGIAAGLLSVAILLVNNIRDIEEDRAARKRTLIVRFGRPFGIALYVGCVVLGALIPPVLWLATGEHVGALLTLLVLPLALSAVRTLRRTSDPAALNPLLGATARLLLLFSVLFSVGWNL